MHASRNDLPILFGDESAGLRGIEYEGQKVSIVSLPAGGDYAPLFKGLPNDMCTAPHWGYVIKGRMRIQYSDSTEEVLAAGDVCYLPPGHIPIIDEDVEFFEVSPPAEVDQVLEALHRNAAAAGD